MAGRCETEALTTYIKKIVKTGCCLVAVAQLIVQWQLNPGALGSFLATAVLFFVLF